MAGFVVFGVFLLHSSKWTIKIIFYNYLLSLSFPWCNKNSPDSFCSRPMTASFNFVYFSLNSNFLKTVLQYTVSHTHTEFSARAIIRIELESTNSVSPPKSTFLVNKIFGWKTLKNSIDHLYLSHRILGASLRFMETSWEPFIAVAIWM